jgi:hypothetical protein
MPVKFPASIHFNGSIFLHTIARMAYKTLNRELSPAGQPTQPPSDNPLSRAINP